MARFKSNWSWLLLSDSPVTNEAETALIARVLSGETQFYDELVDAHRDAVFWLRNPCVDQLDSCPVVAHADDNPCTMSYRSISQHVELCLKSSDSFLLIATKACDRTQRTQIGYICHVVNHREQHNVRREENPRRSIRCE